MSEIGQIISNAFSFGNSASAATATPQENSFFDELVDVINPLQHIPIVSSVYRGLTGDTISSFANIVGGGLFGGVIGAGAAIASEVIGGISSEQTAFVDAQKTEKAYEKVRITTADWLNPNFGKEVIA